MALAQCCDALATTHQKTNTGSTEYLKKKGVREPRDVERAMGERDLSGGERPQPPTPQPNERQEKLGNRARLPSRCFLCEKRGIITATRQQDAARQVEAHLPVINISSLFR